MLRSENVHLLNISMHALLDLEAGTFNLWIAQYLLNGHENVIRKSMTNYIDIKISNIWKKLGQISDHIPVFVLLFTLTSSQRVPFLFFLLNVLDLLFIVSYYNILSSRHSHKTTTPKAKTKNMLPKYTQTCSNAS